MNVVKSCLMALNNLNIYFFQIDQILTRWKWAIFQRDGLSMRHNSNPPMRETQPSLGMYILSGINEAVDWKKMNPDIRRRGSGEAVARVQLQ